MLSQLTKGLVVITLLMLLTVLFCNANRKIMITSIEHAVPNQGPELDLKYLFLSVNFFIIITPKFCAIIIL